MPASQLKRLKASLRAEGIVGPQQSKKGRKRDNANGANHDKRLQRAPALRNVRDQFNPFELQLPPRDKEKFDITSNKTIKGKAVKGVQGRPGVTKGHGEETRRKTLLKEMQERNKVGGIMDRRFGENDPTMTPEEKILQRFTREKQRRFRNSSMFNLEDDQQAGELTHFGQSLSLDQPAIVDDFEEGDLAASDDESRLMNSDHLFRKRKRTSELDEQDIRDDRETGELQRKKSKGEVMKEVVAKSKYHKYERQQAKEDDEGERWQIDKELPELLALMNGHQEQRVTHLSTRNDGINPDRAAFIARFKDKEGDKEYNKHVRELALDRRSRPAERTKTAEEMATEEAGQTRALEQERLRRMAGQEGSSDKEDDEVNLLGEDAAEEHEQDDARAFGFGASITDPLHTHQLDVEDEDEFVLDNDLIASGSISTGSESEESSGDRYPSSKPLEDDDEDREFIADLLTDAELDQANSSNGKGFVDRPKQGSSYAYPCPQNLPEWLEVVKDIVVTEIPTIVQRIRALYDPRLSSENHSKLRTFVTVLFEYIGHLSDQPSHPPVDMLEMLMRHLHSLAKVYSVDVGTAFRSRLQLMQRERPLAPTPGDMMVFSAIGHIFPTSDHFHQVVTPALLCMTRYFSQKRPESLHDLAFGAYLGALCLHYQRRSKRYIPELLSYVLTALCNLSPVKMTNIPRDLPHYQPIVSLRVQDAVQVQAGRLRFWDVLSQVIPKDNEETLKVSLLHTFLILLDSMAELWASHTAFTEVFGPALMVLQHLEGKACSGKLGHTTNAMISKSSGKVEIMLAQARISRRPLALHNHRPLAIKMSIPKFEDSFDPDKHYDRDQNRKELSKLKAEHKRERKGAMRELRKDANFIARETLREKKEKDREYEKKYKRLIGEIQGEEGREAKLYEREKRLRKRKR